MKKITPIILSGGIGTRLWPLSTKNLPKQFLKLPFGSKFNLFQQTVHGFKNKKKFNLPIIVCGDEHKFLLLDSVKKITKLSGVIVEKIQRNTVISVLLGVLYALKKNNSEFSLVAPSDHYIKNRDYSKLIPHNIDNIHNHMIYGIKPSFPATDYGYIKVSNREKKISKVLSFHEKPNFIDANKFFKRKLFWNSGIFFINNIKLVEHYKKIHPKILEVSKKIIDNLECDLDFLQTSEILLKKLPNISFDNAILEKVENLSMLKLNLIWEDLGTWQSLTNLSTNNKVSLEDDAFIYNNSCNTSVISDRRNTIVNDISDAIVVSYKESLYISSKKNSNKIKEILSEKKNKSISEYQSLFYKPWGHYEIFSRSKNYLLKKISIKPYCRLSLQKHQYRSEHWVVVKGKAKVTMGSNVNILKENQSTFIPIGLKHCIENIGKDYLEIIEVQMGSILSEDDIIRLDDPYKR